MGRPVFQALEVAVEPMSNIPAPLAHDRPATGTRDGKGRGQAGKAGTHNLNGWSIQRQRCGPLPLGSAPKRDVEMPTSTSW